MEYKGKKWHDKCFNCVVCKHQVGSKPFIINPQNETDVYCVGCYEEKFATKCTKCKKVMTTGGVTFKNEVIMSCPELGSHKPDKLPPFGPSLHRGCSHAAPLPEGFKM